MKQFGKWGFCPRFWKSAVSFPSPCGMRGFAFNVVSHSAATGRNASRSNIRDWTSVSVGKAFVSTTTSPPHLPVMSEEVMEYLQPQGNQVFLDLTFGAGGHSQCILESSPNVRLIGLDRDPTAYEYAKELQKKYPERVIPLLGKFSDIPTLFQSLKIKKNSIDGILMDLGVSSMQFDDAERGFMLSKNGPLDMRMDCGRDPQQLSASDILTHINEDHLYKVLKCFGEEKHARKIARALIESRYLLKRFKTTQELAEFVFSLSGEDYRLDKLGRPSHPATKTFQAIRILVNNELNELDFALRIAHYFLKPRGVLVAISFHSLEDSIIKRHLTGSEIDSSPSTIGGGLRKHRTSVSTYTSDEMDVLMRKPWIPINKHVVLPSEEEVEYNPRARSAKLRAAVKA
ncbi:probable methyltransferase-like protein 15 homolog [Macrobrachium rosenbergii]|uniref:probable methyltransferase-like protein 15 homolog n=1 Tax=Macrobrachium rosenbergii TaxID=79674 RepID=UPI0034D775EE